MKSTEVRIGNLVLSDERIVAISGWYLYQKTIGENTNQYDKNLDWKPIPLTEEWLEKFGFERDGDSKCFHNNIAIYKENTFTYNASFFENDNLIEIKYVHQLQNLYYSLTNKELTINI